ncbi:hypothetical protein PAXINDRAFT_16765 [Paxillus involutus ATCC 200175]|uniref:Protein kinase domain-containing protein n=1 Tax=Paxillus involutus ATCC 200175 TaxID=664439 RepID=A0A0C9TSQ8_PAXIN|nr:hypothetical protein PAXINDRAFT_16765 [Paxillus involutus ATCC 200175]
MSQDLLMSDGDASSDGNIVIISSARAELPQPAPWNLDNILSSFPNDLTSSVTREGEHPFASGSYSDIYRGTLRVRGRSTAVAVKAIRTYTTNDGNDAVKKKKLNQEIRVWLNLKYINVLPLFGTTIDFGQFPAMVFPWLEDGLLTSYLECQDDSLTAVERLVLAGDVAVGLQYHKNLSILQPWPWSCSCEVSSLVVHSQTVVHGNLSGSNVLIQPGGRACISDFGMSTLLTELGGSTFSTSLYGGGTLCWAAPELLDLQVPDNADNLRKVVPTPQSDIYSFGGIMQQVTSGNLRVTY